MPSNSAASVAVIHTWPRPSSRANSAARRLGSRCAATSSRSRIGGSPRRSATSSAWARTRPSSSAFCSPVEERAAGICLGAMDDGEILAVRAFGRPPRRGVARAVGLKRAARSPAVPAFERDRGAREFVVGRRRQPLVQAPRRFAPGRSAIAVAMLGHRQLRATASQASSQRFVGKQLVARAHRRFVARANGARGPARARAPAGRGSGGDRPRCR